MKRILVSLATGTLVTVGTFIALLFVRALFKRGIWVMVFLWLFGWPIWLLRYLPGIPYDTLILLSLAVGTLLGYLNYLVRDLLRVAGDRLTPKDGEQSHPSATSEFFVKLNCNSGNWSWSAREYQS
jgi:hypothetical protein